MIILLLKLNAVGRPHFDFKPWRISGQLGGIAADLNGDTLDSVCHGVYLPILSNTFSCIFQHFLTVVNRNPHTKMSLSLLDLLSCYCPLASVFFPGLLN